MISLQELKELVEKHDGNKAKVARLLGLTDKTVRSRCKRIRGLYPDWPHYTYKHELEDRKIGNCFPTNEERLAYLDNPERNLTKQFGRIKDTYNPFTEELRVLY